MYKRQVEWKDEDYEAFRDALMYVCRYLARGIAGDGEGTSKLVTCIMTGARSEDVYKRQDRALVLLGV